MNRHLRLIFVQLLFSLAIGQVGVKVGDLVIEKIPFSEYHYIYFHLLLSVVILSTSWVGYQISTAAQNPLISIFSIQYLILLVDIALVICYFVIVRGAEISNYAEKGVTNILPANIKIETFWSMIIFIIYFIWDMLTKIPNLNYIRQDNYYHKKTSFTTKKFCKRAWATFICLFLSVILFLTTDRFDANSTRATLIDIALISLFFLFRGLKQETKKKYKLHEDQVPEKLKAELGEIPERLNKSIRIKEQHFYLKFFVLKILPLICFIICYTMFFYC